MDKNAAHASRKGVAVWGTTLVLLSIVPLLAGQMDRELLPPDDLREVEVAREMYAGGDYVIPCLAGLPFVEKPPGFQAVVACAYRLAGGPSAPAARFTAAVFALLALAAVFILGTHVAGIEGGALAVVFLAFSQRFIRTAHLVLLDNALTAAVAFAVLFAWLALNTRTPVSKRAAYGAAGFFLGVSFLFKGFVGPAIFGSGFLCFLLLSRRLRELWRMATPLTLAAFLLPVLAWVVPFVLRADAGLVREFFIANHLGRFMTGYISPQRPFYFYLKNVVTEFAPGALLLPWAAWMAWKARVDPENQAGLFLLSLFLGPLVVLSCSVAKDFVYFLPVYPALAVLVSWCAVQAWRRPGRGVRIAAWSMAVLAVLGAACMVGAAAFLGEGLARLTLLGAILALASAGCLHAARRSSPRGVAAWASALLALGWCLWFTGPVSRADIARRGYGEGVARVVRLAGDREILLYHPSDGLRGAAGFYRNRTALEIRDAGMLVRRLARDTSSTVMLLFWDPENDRHLRDINSAALDAGVDLCVETSVDVGSEGRRLLLVSAGQKREAYRQEHAPPSP
jgi:4-amino-4-deoxy-L-arabinose transferase-like glycosyltransferase